MRSILCVLAIVAGFGLVVSYSTSQEAGEKKPQRKELESKLKELRKKRLDENEKELKRVVDRLYRKPGVTVFGGPSHEFVLELLRERLSALLESTEQGKRREDLLVPFLALVKETEAKYKKNVRRLNPAYLYMYRNLVLQTEIEVVKAKMAASRK